MPELPSALQLDALREVANIGCGHAATALSKLVGGSAVRIDVPRVLTASSTEVVDLAGGDASTIGVRLRIEGAVSGDMLLVWPEEDARELASMLLMERATMPLDDAGRSALAEVGNIVGSACLSAIGTLSRLRLVPSTPALVEGTAAQTVGKLMEGRVAASASVVLEARFYTSQVPPLTGQLFVVPDRDSLPRLFQALGL